MKSVHDLRFGPGFEGRLSVALGWAGSVSCRLAVNDQFVPAVRGATAPPGIVQFFPPTSTVAGSRAAARQGVYAATLTAVITALAAMLLGAQVIPAATFKLKAGAMVLGALVWAILAFGIARMMRTAALAALILFLVDRVVFIQLSSKDSSLVSSLFLMVIGMLFLLAYVNGLRGALAYQTFLRTGLSGERLPQYDVPLRRPTG